MNTEVEKIYTGSFDFVGVREWARISFGEDWWYIERSPVGRFVVCFNKLRTDPGPMHTLAALRWK